MPFSAAPPPLATPASFPATFVTTWSRRFAKRTAHRTPRPPRTSPPQGEGRSASTGPRLSGLVHSRSCSRGALCIPPRKSRRDRAGRPARGRGGAGTGRRMEALSAVVDTSMFLRAENGDAQALDRLERLVAGDPPLGVAAGTPWGGPSPLPRPR